jgi:hypothetical protein
MQEPVLFNFATKELSQDAFFCWLLSWGNEKYKNTQMHIIATEIFRDIIEDEIIINKIEIKQQYKKIDFCIRLNENITIVFEDKIKTTEHDNQLERYREIISEEYPEDKLFFVYLKTDVLFQTEYSYVEEFGYKIYDLFSIFDKLSRKTDNDIYNDYMKYLTQKVESYKNFGKIRYSKWGQNEWVGLCYSLQNEIEQSAFYDIWQGREVYWGIIESDYLLGKKVWASLEIKHSLDNNDGRLCVLLHIDDKRLNKYVIRDKLKIKFEKVFVNENIEINNRTGKIINFIRFRDFPVIKNDFIDFIKTKELLKNILGKFENGVKWKK